MRLVVLALVAGCRAEGTFTCATSDQCTSGGVTGTCEATKLCSFTDTSCLVPRRYDSSAGELADRCVAPSTCVEAGLEDGETTLLFDGDPDQPWMATCHAGHEYLKVTGKNFSQYTAGGKSPGTNVRSTYAALRLDLVHKAIDIGDQVFATSTGSLRHDGMFEVTSMPFGVAADCSGKSPATGVGEIDLSGTGFVVSPDFKLSGNNPTGGTGKDGSHGITLQGGGDCGWAAPNGAPLNPFNSIGSFPILEVAYSP